MLRAVIAPLTLRFTTNATGDIAVIGDTLMIAPAIAPSAVNGQNVVGSKIDNNDLNMAFVDVDRNSTAFDSNSATLSLPTGASVLFTGL
jgi:hypothetical protein